MSQPPSRKRLFELAEAGRLSAAALEQALVRAGHLPDRAAWRVFMDRMLLALGAVLLLAGIVFFFAYNWYDLPRLGKLGLVEALLVGAIAGAWYRGLNDLVGRVLLLAAAVLVGVFLAVFGQVYQTGADAYELFLPWALFILPWVVLGRFIPLWLFGLALVDVTVSLYWEQVVAPEMRERAAMFLVLFVFNAGAHVAWAAGMAKGVGWLKGKWGLYLIVILTLYLLVVPTFILIFDGVSRAAGDPLLYAVPVVFAGYLAVCLWYYLRRVRDLFVVAACLFSIIIVDTAFLVKVADVEFWGFLGIGLLVVAQSAGAARWLRKLGGEGTA